MVRKMVPSKDDREKLLAGIYVPGFVEHADDRFLPPKVRDVIANRRGWVLTTAADWTIFGIPQYLTDDEKAVKAALARDMVMIKDWVDHEQQIDLPRLSGTPIDTNISRHDPALVLLRAFTWKQGFMLEGENKAENPAGSV